MGLTQVNTSSHLGQRYHMGRNICMTISGYVHTLPDSETVRRKKCTG